MGKRSTGRKLAMQALYQAELRSLEIGEILDGFFEQNEYHPDTKNWASDLTQKTWENREEIDSLIQKYAIDWDLDRITPVDKSLLRIAFYELLYTKTAPRIVLNEMIELSKKFCGDESPKFLNGIVGKYVDEKCLQG